MFEEGKKVVCINDRPIMEGEMMFGLKKGEIYPLIEIQITKCCGNVLFDVGIKSDTVAMDICVCGRFNQNINPGTSVLFLWERFRPVDYCFADQVLEQVFEQELTLP